MAPRIENPRKEFPEADFNILFDVASYTFSAHEMRIFIRSHHEILTDTFPWVCGHEKGPLIL